MPAKRTIFSSLLLLVFMAAACTAPILTTATAATQVPTETVTLLLPTSTSVPFAATVNGDGIWLDIYNTSLGQLKQAAADKGITYNDDQMRQMVLDDLIAQTLLAHAAYVDGFTLDQAVVDAKLSDMAGVLGSKEALEKWIAQNGYTDASFDQVLKTDLAAEFEKAKIISQVGDTADQVHARQILVSTEARANQVIAELAGADFATVANEYDPLTGGELGWFPKGYLTEPKVEEAAFTLQPGQFSGIIQTELGYHIVYVIERDAAHPLTADARNVLQHLALQDWIAQQKADSVIKILLP